MGASRLILRQIREILRLKYEGGLRHRAIARACGVGVGTVSEYVGRAARAGLGWPLPPELDYAALEARLFVPAAPGCERAAPDVVGVHQELKRAGVTLHLLWEEYRAVHENGYGYSQFCEIYRRWARKLRPSMRQQHRAGEKTFIDFSGRRLHLVDRRTGEEVPVELFATVLGASGYTYAEATRTQKLDEWVGAHTRMVEYFGGSNSSVTLSLRISAALRGTLFWAPVVTGSSVAQQPPRRSKMGKPCLCVTLRPRVATVATVALARSSHTRVLGGMKLLAIEASPQTNELYWGGGSWG